MRTPSVNGKLSAETHWKPHAPLSDAFRQNPVHRPGLDLGRQPARQRWLVQLRRPLERRGPAPRWSDHHCRTLSELWQKKFDRAAPPFHEQTLRFYLPNVDKVFEWAAPYNEFNGQSELIILAVHVLKNTPYIITAPNLCIDYNKWNRPNPPYIAFKWKGDTWQQIPWKDFPPEFNNINLTTGEKVQLGERPAGANILPAEVIARWSNEASLPQFRKILREPLTPVPGCIPMITNGKGVWVTRERFSSEKDLKACQRQCDINEFSKETCPCREIFEGRREDPPRVTTP